MQAHFGGFCFTQGFADPARWAVNLMQTIVERAPCKVQRPTKQGNRGEGMEWGALPRVYFRPGQVFTNDTSQVRYTGGEFPASVIFDRPGSWILL